MNNIYGNNNLNNNYDNNYNNYANNKNDKDIFIDNYKNKIKQYIYSASKYNKHIYDIRPYFRKIVNNNFIIQTSEYFDNSWFTSSLDYTDSLTNSEKYILRSYTHNGDEIVNNLLRDSLLFLENKRLLNMINNKENVVFAVQLFRKNGMSENEINNKFTSKGIIKNSGMNVINSNNIDNISIDDKIILLREYITDLERIINNAPKTTKIIKVFRGVSNNYINNYDNPYVLSGFQSTSYLPSVSYDYMTRYDNSKSPTMYEMIILPETSCICLEKYSHHPTDYEILINTNCIASCKLQSNKIIFNDEMDNNFSNLLVNPTKDNIIHTLKLVISNNTITTNNNINVKGGDNLNNINIKYNNRFNRTMKRKNNKINKSYDNKDKSIIDFEEHRKRLYVPSELAFFPINAPINKDALNRLLWYDKYLDDIDNDIDNDNITNEYSSNIQNKTIKDNNLTDK
jgi:hypothetical protein